MKKSAASQAATPALLAGGNPQIAKADGDAPVQAYIAAMPGWTRYVGRRLDALIVRTEDDKLDEKLVANWIRQASKLPGWIP